MRFKTVYITICLLLTIFTACTKYDTCMDTVDSFGDNRFQILRGPSQLPKSLIDMQTKNEIEYYIYRYAECKDYVYVVGRQGYTVINIKTGELNQVKGLSELQQEHIDVFENNSIFRVFEKR